MNVPKEVSAYMSKIGKKGGAKSKRTWNKEQKKAMVAKKAETLRRKKELTITEGQNDSTAE